MAIATNHKIFDQLSRAAGRPSTQHATAPDYAPNQHIVKKWVKAVPRVRKLMLAGNPDIVGLAYVTKQGRLQIAYIPKNESEFNDGMEVTRDFYTADSMDECTACTPISFIADKVLLDVFELAVLPNGTELFAVGENPIEMEDADAKATDLPGKPDEETFVIRVPAMFPVTSHHGIITGRASNERVRTSVDAYHAGLGVWLATVNYQTVCTNRFERSKLKNADAAIPKAPPGTIKKRIAAAPEQLDAEADEAEQHLYDSVAARNADVREKNESAFCF